MQALHNRGDDSVTSWGFPVVNIDDVLNGLTTEELKDIGGDQNATKLFLWGGFRNLLPQHCGGS